ncbi:RNA-directed DNA polymerase, eukaryota, reverse transcriptase zinc-binding domain protein [Tanacetum coccineum]
MLRIFPMIFKAFAWNVRGLINTPNQDQVIQLLREDTYSLYGLLETHVKKKNLSRICNRLLRNWEWVSNVSSCTGGTRIIVGWDPNSVNVMVLDQSSQVLHCFVEPVNEESSLFCSFVYTAVHTVDRISLWKALHKHKLAVKDCPWVILGDFNACLDPSERSSGCSKITTAMNDFRDCVSDIEVEDIAMSGLRFTWNKKPGVDGGLLKKLDRVLGNSSLMTSFPTTYAQFFPFMLSDHTPAVFVIPEVEGFSMLLREVKAKTFKAYKSALKDEESFLKQKAKVEWLDEGDKNSKYVLNVFVMHFKSVLGMSSEVSSIADLGTKILPESEALHMIRAVSDDEIKIALFSIDGNKAPGPDSSDYRPIACCNVVYKIISTIISNRLKNVLGLLVDENQCAFILSHQISDNILLSQELMRGYHRDRGFAKCAFKVDIQKAYDNVEWKFLSCCLKEFGFHQSMIKWIMSCVTSPSFSVNVNGDHLGYFKGMRGMRIRQGDPLSPYLFTLVMEVFNLVLKRQISKTPSFKYHWLCKELKLTHLCFADDLLLFCHRDSKSAAVFKEALDEFGGMSGLLPSKIKSIVFFGNVKQVGRNNILKVMPFQVGILPIAISPVLSSMQVFWSSVFILPKTIGYEIERLMRDFVWNYGEFIRGKAKVNWDVVCKPKVEGGLGIKSLYSWNIALMAKHMDHIVHRIGDGSWHSPWFDNWHAICPLSDFISKREMLYSGLSLNCKVADVIKDGKWDWPVELVRKYDGLSVISPHCLIVDKSDKVVWKNIMGRCYDFSVSGVWNDIRSRSALVSWSSLVWFSQCIPRHSFMLWLAMRLRLRTHDLLKSRDKGENLVCVFCKKMPDNHNHLFFGCDFPKAVWCRLKDLVKLDHAPNCWSDIISFLLNRPINKFIWSILQRLVLGACVYIVWQERNLRTFHNRSRTLEEVCNLIIDVVRLRVLSLSLNTTAQVYEVADL